MWVAWNRSSPRVTSVTPCSGVVDGDRQMVAARHVLARQHDVAERLGPRRDQAGAQVVPGERPGQRERARDVEAQRERLARGDPMAPLGRAQAATDAGIERLAGRPVRRLAGMGDLGADPAPGAEAGIEHAQPVEAVERLVVERHALRLAHRLAVPVEAEPEQILEDALLELRPAARAVDVLDPQQRRARRRRAPTPRRPARRRRGRGGDSPTASARSG